jgi:amidophosphoribosyltransferase
MIYFARPDSRFFGESLYSYRVRIGEVLARETPVQADIVIGVPDSGIPAAIGYSQWSGIPFGDGLIKNRYVGRTFIQPTQAMREAGIRVKLNPLPDVLAGKRVVVIDDSIVRGTTSLKIVEMMREAGAAEVHMRIASPPTDHSCFYGVDTPERSKLLAARMDVEAMGEFIKADSLAFVSIDGLYRAVGEPGRTPACPQFCDACFTGDYPTALTDVAERESSDLLTLPLDDEKASKVA